MDTYSSTDAKREFGAVLIKSQREPVGITRNNKLIKNITREPFSGLGDPEPLKHHWSSYWSRRIDREHRFVYKVTDKAIIIVQCRYHY